MTTVYVEALLFVASLLPVSSLKTQETPMPGPPNLWPWSLAKLQPPQGDENFFDFIYRITDGLAGFEAMKAHVKYEAWGLHPPPIDSRVIPKFSCPVLNCTGEKPTTAHQLRPCDVDIVASMGDSITAAFAAKALTPVDIFIEFRGVSWSIGGAQDVDRVLTLPNILKKYNRAVTGFSRFPTLYGLEAQWENLDVAVSGATSYDMPSQARKLVQKLLAGGADRFKQTWKVLTVFIGGNDLCACCKDETVEKYSPQNYLREIQAALDLLHKEVPRMFVNLVSPPDVTALSSLSSPYCDFFHWLVCKCGTVFGPAARNYTRQVREKYLELLSELVDSGRYDTREDFTVVLQPFFDETIIPIHPDGSVDRSYFAPDCFHFSQKSHASSALALWNSMFERVGSKSKKWHEGEQFICPTDEAPYFFTRKNSQKFANSEAVVS